MDMVCEKNEAVKHDFSKDPIRIKREGDWITAEGTTLGADNGIGVAVALALAKDKSARHGPLEILFTVDEETGMTGAFGLEPGLVKGRRLINLDTEDFGVIYIGCAGGGNSIIKLPLKFTRFKEGKLVRIRVSGLRGGHSGVEIDKGRANSIRLLGRLLWKIAHQLDNLRVVDLKGGNKPNAIPREASATIVVAPEKEKKLKELLAKELSFIKIEYGKVEPNIKIKTEAISEEAKKELTCESTLKAINLIQVLPHGVLAMSQEVPDLVETSTNLATVSIEEAKLKIIMSTRSSIGSALEATRERIHAIAESFGAEIEEEKVYPGWKPNLDSPLLQVAKNVYKKLFNQEVKVKAIHAGLETGIIGKKFGEMDMISFGPQIEHAHSPDERVYIPSVEKFWLQLTATLEALAKEK
jgi:dipeptidase D